MNYVKWKTQILRITLTTHSKIYMLVTRNIECTVQIVQSESLGKKLNEKSRVSL